jgi:osmotically-inducible protein OsmY
VAQQQAADPETDLYIYEAVRDALDGLTQVRETKAPLEITVENAVVTIGGAVFTEPMRRAVLFTASTVTGVRKVVDRLYDDEDLRIAVAQALAAAPELHEVCEPIGVASYQGAITLYGKVGTQEQRRAATRLASGVTGVRHVRDNLAVSTTRR